MIIEQPSAIVMFFFLQFVNQTIKMATTVRHSVREEKKYHWDIQGKGNQQLLTN